MDICPALVAAARTRPDSAFAKATRRHATAGTPARPGSLHPAPSRAAAPLSPTSPDHEHVPEPPLRIRLATRDRVTFGADRSWGETLQFATHANACADRRPTSAPSRAGLLNMASRRIAPTTAVRARARGGHSTRYRAAFGPCPSRVRLVTRDHLGNSLHRNLSPIITLERILNPAACASACGSLAPHPNSGHSANDARSPQMRSSAMLVADLLETGSNIVLSTRFA